MEFLLFKTPILNIKLQNTEVDFFPYFLVFVSLFAQIPNNYFVN